MEWTPKVGEKVIAKISMIDDLTDHGMGRYECAKAGDELIIREITKGGAIAVSHEHVTNNSFFARLDEIEPAPMNEVNKPEGEKE